MRAYKEKKRLAKLQAYGNSGVSTAKPATPPIEVITQPRKERLATTTRKMKKPSAEDDYEKINDYKTVFDIEREKEAQRQALYLLKKYGF